MNDTLEPSGKLAESIESIVDNQTEQNDLDKQATDQECDCDSTTSSTLEDLLDIDAAFANEQHLQKKCDKCDGDHATEVCPSYPLPRENHPDATTNQGKQVQDEIDITLPENTPIIHQTGDGSCLFHALAYHLRRKLNIETTGEELRQKAATFIEEHMDTLLKEKTIAQWIEDMHEGSAPRKLCAAVEKWDVWWPFGNPSDSTHF